MKKRPTMTNDVVVSTQLIGWRWKSIAPGAAGGGARRGDRPISDRRKSTETSRAVRPLDSIAFFGLGFLFFQFYLVLLGLSM